MPLLKWSLGVAALAAVLTALLAPRPAEDPQAVVGGTNHCSNTQHTACPDASWRCNDGLDFCVLDKGASQICTQVKDAAGRPVLHCGADECGGTPRGTFNCG